MRDQDATVLVNFESKEEIAGLLEQAYTELGKAYYEGGFEDPLPQLLPMFDRITDLKNKLEQEAARAPQPEPAAPMPEEVQPAPQPAPAYRPGQPRFCIYCGSRLKPGDLFCSNCGHRIR